MFKLIFSSFLFGLSLGLGPCLVSCGPLVISYIAGTRKNIAQSICAYLLFSLSRIIVYLGLGLAVFLLGRLAAESFFSQALRYLFIFGGIFILAVGLFMVFGKSLDFKFCRRAENLLCFGQAKTIFIFGLIMGIMPCLPLVSVLSYLGLISKTWIAALVYILSFGIGTIISPLLILAASAGLIPVFLKNKDSIYRIFSAVCGLVICFLGLRLLLRAF